MLFWASAVLCQQRRAALCFPECHSSSSFSHRQLFSQATGSPVMPNFFVDLFSEVNKQLKEEDGCATEDNYFCFFIFKLQ